MSLVLWLVVLTYVSLALEIIVYPVPSVVSAARLAREPTQRRARGWEIGKGILAGLAFFLPLVTAFWTPPVPLFQPVFEPLPSVALGIGVILILAGRGLGLAAVFTMRRGMKPFAGQEPTTLLVNGCFQLSRNPILLGLYLTYAGLICLGPMPAHLLGFAYLVLHMHGKVRGEEANLRRVYGERYHAYCARTRRYL